MTIDTSDGFEKTEPLESDLDYVNQATSLDDEPIAVLAPARPKGYGVKDLRAVAQRDEQLFVLGRGSDELAERLRALDASVTLVGSDLNVARTLIASKEPGAVIAQLLDATRRRDEGQLGQEPPGRVQRRRPN